jgi:hypothetical protein
VSAEGTYEAVRACAVLLLTDAVLQIGGVSAGRGQVIDWRTVKSGETLQDGADAFDTAQLFVTLVGPAAALSVCHDVPWAPPIPEPAPRVVEFMASYNGGRRRQFGVGRFTVVVEPHEDDDAQAAFTSALARIAVEVGT